MREMKDSGIEWIGEIPADWNIKRVKAVLCERNESNNPIRTDKILSLTNDRGVIPYEEKGDVGNKSKEDLTGYKLAYPGDIVLNSMNVFIGSVALSSYFGCVSPVYYMLYPRNKNDSVSFFNYLFQTKELQTKLHGYGNGIMEIRMRIQMSKLNSVQLPVPPSDVQHKIANYLDRKCSRIDAIIARQQEVIEKLKAYKLSVITEAVTKGLNPNVPMKDSGVEWIGEIPEHWKIAKLKNYCHLKTGITPSTSNAEWFDGEVQWFTPGDFNESYQLAKSKRTLSINALESSVAVVAPVNTVMIIGIGATAGKVGFSVVECSFNQQITALLTNSVNPKFLMYWMIANSKFLRETALFTTLPILNNQTIGSYLLLCPENDTEEKQIADYLDEKCNELECTIAAKEKIISKLAEYKKALIYEVVTGKREV